jgi:hypothetical protein
VSVQTELADALRYYGRSVLPRAFRDWWTFLRRHFAKEIGLAALVFAVAWLRHQDELLKSVGDSFLVLLQAVVVFAAVLFLWELLFAPMRVHRDLRNEMADREAQFTAYRGHSKRIAQQYGSNIMHRASLPAVVRLVVTELKDIQNKVDVMRATGPANHYADVFALPAARWDEYDEVLAEHPELYAVAERAYTAVHRSNEVVATRRWRAGAGKTLGVFTHRRRSPGKYGSRKPFRHHALELLCGHDTPQRLGVVEARHRCPAGAGEVERLEDRAAFRVRLCQSRQAVNRQEIEGDESHRDAPVAHQHPTAEKVEARSAVRVEADQFAVELQAFGQRLELRDKLRHSPASPAARTKPGVRVDHAAVPVQLRLVRPAVTGRWRRRRSRQHRSREPHSQCQP